MHLQLASPRALGCPPSGQLNIRWLRFVGTARCRIWKDGTILELCTSRRVIRMGMSYNIVPFQSPECPLVSCNPVAPLKGERKRKSTKLSGGPPGSRYQTSRSRPPRALRQLFHRPHPNPHYFLTENAVP